VFSDSIRPAPAFRGLGIAIAVLLILAVVPASAGAVIQPPVTVDGPSNAILEFGGVAMAPDGTGGLVYTKAVEGTAHVFVSRYDGRNWSAPVRVDREGLFEGSQPRIAAGEKGALMVVWASPVATVGQKVRYGLWSASLGPGAGGFGSSLLVDANVGDASGLDPSLAGVAAGKAIVAYRVVTEDFSERSGTAVQLRPGDVLADVRVARFAGDRWSKLGAVNRNPATSMRPLTAANGPQVAIGATGNAVVAWQEPDQSAVARIWVRRVFGNTLGPAYLASPATWEGQPVSADVDSFSLDVAELDQARVVSHVDAGGSSPGTPRIFLETLGASYATAGSKPEGLVMAAGASGPPPGPLGVGSVAASTEGGGAGLMRLAYTAGGGIQDLGVEKAGNLISVPAPGAPPAQPEAAAVAALEPAGGSVVAYPSSLSEEPAVAVVQEYATGGSQVGLLSGADTGAVSGLSIGRAGTGDALIGFRQGSPGHLEIVGDRVSAPPAALKLQVPAKWMQPRRVTIRWARPQSAVGGLSYSLLVDGHPVKEGIVKPSVHPGAAVLGNGVQSVQVMATDGLGGQVLSKPTTLRVDAEPPQAAAKLSPDHHSVTVRLSDSDSGLVARSTRCNFGDGTSDHGGAKFSHTYQLPGNYRVVVTGVDRVGNRMRDVYPVRVR
jgi:PKD domain